MICNGMAITTAPKGRFGQWLLDRFAERGWESYRQAAEYTKVSHTQLRSYVQGVTPRPGALVRLADFFGVPRADLDEMLGLGARPAWAENPRTLIRETVHETLAQMGHPRVAGVVTPEHEAVAAAFDRAIRALPDEMRTQIASLFRDELRRHRREVVARQ